VRFEGQERPLRVLKRTSNMTVAGPDFFAGPDEGRERMLALAEVSVASTGQMALWSLPSDLAPAEYERFLLWDFNDTTTTSVTLVAAGDFDPDRQPRLIYDEVPLPQPRPWVADQRIDDEDDEVERRYREWLDDQEGGGEGDPA
jgi:hypothetical protein